VASLRRIGDGGLPTFSGELGRERRDARVEDVREATPAGHLPALLEKVSPEEILWVASHDDLYGDPLLGENKRLRFRPSDSTRPDPRSTPREWSVPSSPARTAT